MVDALQLMVDALQLMIDALQLMVDALQLMVDALYRQLVNSRNRIATGLKKILETNAQVHTLRGRHTTYVNCRAYAGLSYVHTYMYSRQSKVRACTNNNKQTNKQQM